MRQFSGSRAQHCTQRRLIRVGMLLGMVWVGLTLTGCAQVPVEGPAYDPAESLNRQIYDVNMALDRAVLGPLARGYSSITPRPIQRSIGNFFTNISYLDTMLHALLQGKFSQGVDDFFRFFVNSTVGIGGIFDVAGASGMQLNDEDFGQTLAVWGADEGAYVMMPIMGPDNVRDLSRYATTQWTDLTHLMAPQFFWPLKALSGIHKRASLESSLKLVQDTSPDPYMTIRESVRQQRVSRIYDGNPPEPDFWDDFFEEEENALDE